MKTVKGCAISCLVVLLLGFAVSLSAQTETASLSGRVTDPHGAVVPRAVVEAIENNTNVKTTTETNNDGLYYLRSLHPGSYRVVVSKDGFKQIIQADVVLHVQDVLTLNFALQIGSVSESVTVSGGAPLINTESAAVSTVVDRQFVENLPLNGRSFQSLFELTPGVVLTKAIIGNDGQFSVNGQRANANYFTVDGVSANFGTEVSTFLAQSGGGTVPGFNVFGGTSGLVSVDGLQEFKIQTSTYAPEFGRTPGAQVSILTRSGTNEFHGTLFEYLRNDALDANDWFANQNKLRKPPERQSDFGGVLGGPIIKNRTFFFFSYEGLRLRQPKVGVTQVPSVDARQSAPQGVKPFLNAYPVPSGGNLGNNLAGFSASYSDPSSLDSTSIRIDHAVNSRLTVFARYNYAPSRDNERGFSGFSLNTVERIEVNTQTLTVGAPWIISPRVTNDFRVNWSRSRGSTQFMLDDFGGATPPPDSINFPPFASSKDSLFFFAPLGFSGSFLGTGKNADNTQSQINIIDSVSVAKGSHALKVGVDYRRLSPELNLFKYFLAPTFFSGISGALTGIADLISLSGDSGPRFPLFNNLSVFGQDTWRIGPRFILTYGVRWDMNPGPTEKKGNDPFAVTGVSNPATLALAPRGTPLYNTTYRNFAPRVGIAYQLSRHQGRETVLRGGWGIFYDLGAGLAGNAFSRFPYTSSKNLARVPFPADSAVIAIPPITLNPPFASITAFDPNLKLPRTYQWNAALAQSLGSNQALTLAYVGAVGRYLDRSQMLVNPNPSFTTVLLTTSDGTSDYHALQLQFNRRLSRGLQALASYTWSHSIDIASSDSQSNVPNQRVDPLRDRGPSDFDVRHSFRAAVTYDIPVQTIGRFLGALTHSWSIDGVFRAQSATPINVVTGQALFGVSSPPVGRPNLNPGVPLYIDDPSVAGGRRINSAAFSIPPAGTQGNLGRNTLRGFPVSQMDLALRRQFKLTERVKLQFRAEFFNVFNHPNFGDPGSGGSRTNALNNPQFGQSTTMLSRSLGGGGLLGGFNALYQIGGPRSGQLALKLQF